MKLLKVLCLLFCLTLLTSACKSKIIEIPSNEFIGEENEDDILQSEDEEESGENAPEYETKPSESVALQTEDSLPHTVTASPDEPVAVAMNKDNNLYGYINIKGEWVIAPQYSVAYPFCNNAATVCKSWRNPEWLIIDKENNVVASLGKGVYVWPLYVKVFGDTNSDVYRTIVEDMIIITDKNQGFDLKFGFANSKGEIVVEPKYVKVQHFSDGLAAVNFNTEAEPSWGYIDKQGNTVIAAQFDYVRPFYDGRAYAERPIEDSQPGMCAGYIDKTGNMVIHGNWVEEQYGPGYMLGYIGPGSDFADEVAFVQWSWESNAVPGLSLAQGLGIIDKSGGLIYKDEQNKYWSQPSYNKIGDGLYAIEGKPNSNGDCPVGFMDSYGNEVIAPQMEWKIYQFFTEGLCAVSFRGPEGRSGYIDKSGKLVIEAKYISASNFSNGFAAVCEASNNWKYIDKTGKESVIGEYKCAGYPFTK